MRSAAVVGLVVVIGLYRAQCVFIPCPAELAKRGAHSGRCLDQCQLSGVERTCRGRGAMSANDPKRTSGTYSISEGSTVSRVPSTVVACTMSLNLVGCSIGTIRPSLRLALRRPAPRV